MRYALLPAAGHSRRMSRPKLALPLGERTVLEHVLAALRDAGVERTLVVLGPHVAELGPIAARSAASVQTLEAATADMRATVEHGLRWIEEHWRPRDEDYWLLVPADHPTLAGDVVRRLAVAQEGNPAHSIFVPTHGDKRGHPTLLAWKHVAGILAHPAGEGLNAYIRGRAAETLEVPVDDAAVLWDLDTPADYERLLRAATPTVGGGS
jgi:CTP:molybdopterin cytidylyltransferase MocA